MTVIYTSMTFGILCANCVKLRRITKLLASNMSFVKLSAEIPRCNKLQSTQRMRTPTYTYIVLLLNEHQGDFRMDGWKVSV